MKTHFTEEQLADPNIAEADQILKTCQHFGFCTSGCPTYVLLHDENDGPRGRIDLIKDMLESDRPPAPKTVEHVDRCLSCMSCMTTCAVKVDYMHLVDTAREHIEKHHRRPLAQRWMRAILAYVLPRPRMFRVAVGMGRIAARFERLAPPPLRPLLGLVPMAPSTAPEDCLEGEVFPAEGQRRWRVALLTGCVQPEMSPQINSATIRMLTRHGCEVVVPKETGCCGSLPLHMGKVDAAREFARVNVSIWGERIERGELDAVIVNASGCGTTVKDYAHLLKNDSQHAVLADHVAKRAMDICEWLVKVDIAAPEAPRRHRVAYHDACSLRNAQKVTAQPRALLRRAGFDVADVPESHLCCGSAGTYNMLQPELARQLGSRKAANIISTSPQIVAAGNIGCVTQIGLYSKIPIVHTVELLDWAYGGPVPLVLRGLDLPELQHQPEPQPHARDSSKQVIQFHPKSAGADDVGVW